METVFVAVLIFIFRIPRTFRITTSVLVTRILVLVSRIVSEKIYKNHYKIYKTNIKHILLLKINPKLYHYENGSKFHYFPHLGIKFEVLRSLICIIILKTINVWKHRQMSKESPRYLNNELFTER